MPYYSPSSNTETTPQKPLCDQIRQTACATVSEKMQGVILSSFTAEPILEEEYLDHIQKDPLLFELYKKWILSMNPFPIPKDEHLYQLRDSILEPLQNIIATPESYSKKINRPSFFLLLDILMPLLLPLILKGLAYYETENTGHPDIDLAIERSATSALLLCSEQDIRSEGYPNFTVALLDKFRVFFFMNLSIANIVFPEKNTAFVAAFEREWKKLYPYSDMAHGFDVVPRISFEDLFCYLKLPFQDRMQRRLSSSPVYQSAMNYVVALATFKPAPVIELKSYAAQELHELFAPLRQKTFRTWRRKKSYLSDRELAEVIDTTAKELFRDFQFFYASTKKLEKDDAYTFRNLIAPVGYGKQLIRLGHLFHNNEYPFTAYLNEKLQQKMRAYIGDDLPALNTELDDEIEDEDGNRIHKSDLFSKERIDVQRLGLPIYDFKDASGSEIGWSLDVFAGIVRKSRHTLRRWDKEGFLPAKRAGSFRRYKPGKYAYRYYERNDIERASEIAAIKLRKKQHRT